LLQGPADGLDPARDPALAVHLHDRRHHQDRQQDEQRRGRDQEELLGARLEEVGGRDDDPAKQGQRMSGRSAGRGSDQDREGLAHPANVAGEHHRPGRLAGLAGNVADISTPIIVADVTSLRRTW
jgi:hypothetical protein